MPPQRVSTVSNGNTILFPPHRQTLLLLYSFFFFYDNPLFIYFQLQTLNNNCGTDFETKPPRRTSNAHPYR